MSKDDRPKTSRTAQTKSKAKRLKKPDKVGQKAPKPNRRIDEVEETKQPDPDLGIYERAIGLFNEGSFQAAKETFAELAGSSNRNLAHSAEMRIRICEQRLAPALLPAIPEIY
jgi:hypothetical protein